MSQHSPRSSGLDPSSSPFAGTDPTLYSPEIVRDARSTQAHNVSSVSVAAAGKQALREVFGQTDKKKHALPHPAPYIKGGFTNEIAEDAEDYVTRYHFISRLPNESVAGMDIDHELYAIQHQMRLYACFANSVPLYNRGIYVRFDDLRESAEAKEILYQHCFSVDYITGSQHAIARSQDTALADEFEGQVQLSIFILPIRDVHFPTWNFGASDLVEVGELVEKICDTFGSVRNCVHVDTNDVNMLLTFRIEFHSNDAALRAIHNINNEPFCGFNKENTYEWFTCNPTRWAGEHAINSPREDKSRVDDRGRFIGYRPAANPLYDYRNSRHPSDQHNRVRRERILDGSDVRTTIMLRNIPNKLDWMALKAILDEACFGTYDFVYLRIDFKSACNVGYAFINFADVKGMISLIDKIERRCWVGFRSDKAAEISYATIQGREALTQKFRNSSVMQETPFCRPRLFLTYADVAQGAGVCRSTGTEQAFPIPDNLSKLQRSMDSAQTIGLFPPHGYPCVPPDHRNRNSVWDRGTPRDIMQTAMHFSPQHGPNGSAQVPPHALTEGQKRNIENWYSANCGRAHAGIIPFEYIPVNHVSQYLAYDGNMSPGIGSAGFGAVGGPSYGQAAMNTTPTRVPRGVREYVLPNPGAYMSQDQNTPFN